MAKFSDLSLRAQRELMEEYRNKGINDLSDMIADYDREESSDTTSSGTSVSVPFSLAETYRNGGKIHIKPENRGKFTALKKRTGHSASWFKAHGTPAQKKMAVFALNARKWKHADGGHIYDGYNEPINQLWQVQYPEAPEEYNGGTLPAAVMTAPLPAKFNGSQAAAKRYAEGYKWATENVTKPTNKIAHDYVAPALAATLAAPVAIDAAASIVANPWLRLAADTAGNIDGIRNAASENGVAKTVRLAKEGDTLGAIKSGIGDVLDIAGTSDLIRTASRFRGPNLRLHAFNSVEPFGYDKPFEKAGRLIKDVVEDSPVNISSAPTWRSGERGKALRERILDAGIDRMTADAMFDTREDAWRIYNGLPQRNNMYIQNPYGSYSYNIEKVKTYFPNGKWLDLEGKHDDFLQTAGGLWKDETTVFPDRSGIRHIEDLWDLHPFSRRGMSFSSGIAGGLKTHIGDKAVRDKVQRFREFMYDKGYWSSYSNKANGVIGKATKWMDYPLNRFRNSYNNAVLAPNGYHYESLGRLDRGIDKFASLFEPLDKKLKSFELGKLTGGKPFMMKTDIPFTGATFGDSVARFNGWGPVSDNVLATGGPADTFKKLFAPTYDTPSFSDAFGQARQAGKSYFKWNGKRYNTRLNTEVFQESNPFNYEEGYSLIDAARRIREVENSKDNPKGGYDSNTGRWYPHRSHEGGADTVAYGIKLSNGTPEAALAKQQGYLTDAQANEAVDSLVRTYGDSAKRVYDKKFGEGAWDDLSEKSKSILIDYEYNPGLSKFPNLMTGFHDADLDKIKANYKRYSRGKELGRNRTLAKDIDSLSTFYPILGK